MMTTFGGLCATVFAGFLAVRQPISPMDKQKHIKKNIPWSRSRLPPEGGEVKEVLGRGSEASLNLLLPHGISAHFSGFISNGLCLMPKLSEREFSSQRNGCNRERK